MNIRQLFMERLNDVLDEMLDAGLSVEEQVDMLEECIEQVKDGINGEI